MASASNTRRAKGHRFSPITTEAIQRRVPSMTICLSTASPRRHATNKSPPRQSPLPERRGPLSSNRRTHPASPPAGESNSPPPPPSRRSACRSGPWGQLDVDGKQQLIVDVDQRVVLEVHDRVGGSEELR